MNVATIFTFQVSTIKYPCMKLFLFIGIVFFLISSSCKKPDVQPKSKTDYIPIISSISPITVKLGNPIISKVKCGFYEHSANITFLNFDVKEIRPKQFEIRAKAFYDNILYGISIPVVSTFDTTMVLQTSSSGQFILKFYSFNQLVQADTVTVN